MRAAWLVLLWGVSLSCWADAWQALYQAAGWPQQNQHFNAALKATQKRYQNNLPSALYQALLNNSNNRFAPQAMSQRAEQKLRSQLTNPQPALAFFNSALGRKVTRAELIASSPEQLKANAQGIPRVAASPARRQLITQLSEQLPASQASAEVSLALAGVAADSLSQMLPGLLGQGNASGLLDSQRQRLISQINSDLPNTLLYVYRSLSDAELKDFVHFTQSPAGTQYYQAALSSLRAALTAQE